MMLNLHIYSFHLTDRFIKAASQEKPGTWNPGRTWTGMTNGILQTAQRASRGSLNRHRSEFWGFITEWTNVHRKAFCFLKPVCPPWVQQVYRWRSRQSLEVTRQRSCDVRPQGFTSLDLDSASRLPAVLLLVPQNPDVEPTDRAKSAVRT